MISIVIPARDEQDNLEPLFEELREVITTHALDAEIIFVDDGSRDGTWARIRRLAERDPRVRGIRLRRNFGKAAALVAGFRAARGELIFTLDADLQDDPNEIPNFLRKLEEGFDAVNGWKRKRHDPWHKVIPSRIFNLLVSWMTGLKLHDHNCGFKCYRTEVLREIRLYGELHRFVPVLAHARGFRVAEIPVRHRPRTRGRSKYGPKRFIKGFLDLLTVKFLTGYGQRPLHVLGSLGMLAFVLGLAGIVYLGVLWLFPSHRPIGTRPLLTYSLLGVLLGAQMISIGFLAELLIAVSAREEAGFSIAERVGWERDRGDRPQPQASSSDQGPNR